MNSDLNQKTGEMMVVGADLRRELGLTRRDWEGLLARLPAEGTYSKDSTGRVAFTREGAEKLRAFLRKNPPAPAFPAPEGVNAPPAPENAPSAPSEWVPATVLRATYANRRIISAKTGDGQDIWVAISDQWQPLYKPGMAITVQFQREPNFYRTRKPRAVGRQ